MIAKLRSVLLVLTLTLALVPLGSGVQAAAQEGSARVRFVHASFDAPSLDAYVDSVLAAGGVRGASGYMDVAPGEHTFIWRSAGGAEDLASVSLTVEAGQRVTIAAMNSLSALEARAYVDDVSAPARNAARVKVIHAVPDGAAINVATGDVTVASGLNYGEASDPVQLYAGSYDFAVTATDGTALTTDALRAITEDRTYTLFVVGMAASNAYRVVAVESTVLPPEATSQFRFANMAQGAGALDVHINKEPAPLYSNVPFGSVQNSFVAGIGEYLFEVYTAGTNTLLASGTATINPNESVLFIAQGAADSLSVEGYVADLSALPPQSSRLTVINVAAGNPAIRVERLDGKTLIESVDLFGSASTTVPAGNYNIRFADAGSGAMMMEQGGVNMLSGTATVMIAFDDDPADPLINAVTVPVENVPQDAAIRWAHLNIWGPPVDVYLDGEQVVSSLVYKMVTEYQLYTPKIYTVSVYAVGSDPTSATPLDSQTIELTGDNFPRTLFIYGQPDQAKIGVAPDSFELLPEGVGRVRFINTAIDSTGVAVYNPTDGSRVVDNIQFGQVSVNANVAEGSYTFNFVGDGGPIASVQGLAVEAGKSYTVVLAGVVSDQTGVETIVLTAEQ